MQRARRQLEAQVVFGGLLSSVEGTALLTKTVEAYVVEVTALLLMALEAYVVEGAALLSTTLVAYAPVRLCSCRWHARRRLVIRMWPHSPVSLRYSLCAELPPRPRMRGAHPHRQGQSPRAALVENRDEQVCASSSLGGYSDGQRFLA